MAETTAADASARIGTAHGGSPSQYEIDQVARGARRTLIERTRAGARVLDIGCWSGYTGAFLAREREAVVDGVEPVPTMARLAQEHYRDVYVGRVEEALRELLPQRSNEYDTLLLLDVLEHLVDPWWVLGESRNFLAPGGRALLSVPNVAHWSMRRNLLRGNWTYEDSGLLDRTHLRFFTRATLGDLVRGAGWKTVWESSVVDPPRLLRPAQRWRPILERWPGLCAFQFLVEIEPI